MPMGPDGLLICNSPPWSRRKKHMRSPPPWYKNRNALSAPQLKACLELARAATAAFGKRGKAKYKGVNMPIVAVEVAKTVKKGSKIHGGLSRAERATRAHGVAPASIASLEAILATKIAVPV